MIKPEAQIFKIIQNVTNTLKKIRLFKAHLLIARSIFEKEATTADGKKPTNIHLRGSMENCHYVLMKQRAPKREREIINSASERNVSPTKST